jgi:hypothetical protein
LTLACRPTLPEVCDGVDNDRDGQVDEDFMDKGQVCTVGIGACQAQGIRVCMADGTGTECNAVAGTPSPEVCDDLDNDCDGQVDEDDVCPTPQPDICDGLDNDFDPSTADGADDPDVGQPCEVGVGECLAKGVRLCLNGQLVCNASPGSPTAEICDGLDNDCDGQVDDACTCAEDDIYEDNDSGSSPFRLSGPRMLGDLILCPGDQDWFSIDLSSYQTVSVIAEYSMDQTSARLVLYDSNQSVVAQATNDGTRQQITYRHVGLTSGTYRIAVIPGDYAKYSLSVGIQ